MAGKSVKNAGLIGLGIIGSRVAAALREAGYDVYVWSRTPKTEPNFLGSPAEVAEHCDVIQLFVSDGEAVEKVIRDMAPKLTSQHVVLCHATVGVEATRSAAALVHQTGAKFLDAPFTGSKSAAAEKALCYYIGGEDAVLEKVRPVLEVSSKAIVKIGGIGDAAVLKVATNMMVAISFEALAEAFAFVKKHGLNPATLESALEHHAVRSGLVGLKLPRMLQDDYEAFFSIKHMLKDIRLALQMGAAAGIDLPVTENLSWILKEAMHRGWEEKDFSIITKLAEDRAVSGLTPGAATEATPEGETPKP